MIRDREIAIITNCCTIGGIMKSLVIASILIFAPAVFAQRSASPNPAFWQSLKTLCGKAYAGKVVTAPANDSTFNGKKLVMHVFSCEPQKIKIKLLVGDDRSRTWLLYQYKDRLLLKHDHRKRDGKRDDVTDYGGWTTNSGTSTRQVFSADQETFSNTPAAATNVWWIDLAAGDHFTYNLQRIGTDRAYSLKFDISKAVPFLIDD